MPSTSTPDANDTNAPSWPGYAYDDPFPITTHNNRIVPGKELVDHQNVTLWLRDRVNGLTQPGGGVLNGAKCGLPNNIPAILKKYKKLDQVVSDSSTMVNDAELFATLTAGKKYAINVRLFCTSVATSGVQIDLNNSVGVVGNLILSGVFFTAAALAEANAAALATAIGSTALVTRIDIAGCIEMLQSGRVGLRFAQNAETGAAESITLKRGSWLSFEELPQQ